MEEQQGFPPGRAMFMHTSQPVVTGGQITVPSPGERPVGSNCLWSNGGLWKSSLSGSRSFGVWEHIKRGAVSYLEKKGIKCAVHRSACIIL